MNNRLLYIIAIINIISIQNIEIMANKPNTRTETPEYRLIKDLGEIEIREYPEIIIATTDIGSNYSGNSGRGFSTVAGYIFGGNERKEKISMTSPVMVDMADTMKMSFIMPSKYDMDDLPGPADPAVKLQKQKSRTLAVISFGGWANDTKLEKYRDLLSSELKKHNIEPVGDYMYFGYNPPYKLVNRLNEVAVEIDNEQP